MINVLKDFVFNEKDYKAGDKVPSFGVENDKLLLSRGVISLDNKDAPEVTKEASKTEEKTEETGTPDTKTKKKSK